jgi:hypothetical protein
MYNNIIFKCFCATRHNKREVPNFILCRPCIMNYTYTITKPTQCTNWYVSPFLQALRDSRCIALICFLELGTIRGWGVSVTPRPLSTPGKDPVPIIREAGWAPGPVWTCAKNLAPTGIRSPDRPARRQSLPGPPLTLCSWIEMVQLVMCYLLICNIVLLCVTVFFCALYCVCLLCTCCHPNWGFSMIFPQL